MRYLLLLSSAAWLAAAVTVASAAALPIDGVVSGQPIAAIKRTVYLDHLVLEELQKSSPERYARVQRVLTAASELCAPNAARLWAAANVDAGDCSSLMLKTSYPPKRQLSFVIEDTLYIAQVTVRDAPALMTPVPGRAVPANQPPVDSPAK